MLVFRHCGEKLGPICREVPLYGIASYIHGLLVPARAALVGFLHDGQTCSHVVPPIGNPDFILFVDGLEMASLNVVGLDFAVEVIEIERFVAELYLDSSTGL